MRSNCRVELNGGALVADEHASGDIGALLHLDAGAWFATYLNLLIMLSLAAHDNVITGGVRQQALDMLELFLKDTTRSSTRV